MIVRANANFAGAKVGEIHRVDGNDPEVRSKIAKGWFSVIEDEPEPTPPKRRKK